MEILKRVMRGKILIATIALIIFGIFDAVVDVVMLRVVSMAIDHYTNPLAYIGIIVSLYLVVTVTNAAARFSRSMTSHWIFTELYEQCTVKVLRSDYDMFTKFNPSDIVTTTDRLFLVSSLPGMIVSIIADAMKFISSAIAIVTIDSRTFTPIMVLYTIGGISIFRMLKKWGEIDNELDIVKRKRNKELDDVINGFQEVRSFPRAESIHQERILDMNHVCLQLVNKRQQMGIMFSTTGFIVEALCTIMIVILATSALRTGTLTSQSLAISLVTYSWRLMSPLMSFMNTSLEFSEKRSALPGLQALLSYDNKITDGDIKLDSFDNNIKFEHVSFSYNNTSTVLNDISFVVNKGEHVGICGPSGGGKSTLLKLIPRFYAVQSGSIEIDGVNINNLTKDSIKSHVGIVHQSPYIFDGTIRDNVTYPTDTGIDDVAIVDACKRANIYEFIQSLPDGMNTIVGPRGIRLSGGQKQRIALARLFLTNPDIIILDEATSALDSETETIIQESLNAFKNKTMIVVAHRLSTIKDSDKILVIDNHKIVEEGTHQELINKHGVYFNMLK